MCAEHEVRMPAKPAIDPDGAFVVGGRPDLIDIEPQLISLRLSGLALAEEQDVDDDIRAGVTAKAAFGQPDCRDQFCGFGDMLACRRIGLVHGAMRGDEGGERAGLQQVNRPGDEIVVQTKAKRPVSAVRADGAIGEGRIADGEIVDRSQIRTGKVAIDDPRLRLEKVGDAGGDRIKLDPGHKGCVAKWLRHQCREQSRADARFQHPAAAPAQFLDPSPDCPDDELRREMCILGAAGKRRIIAFAYRALERRTNIVPALAEIDITRPTEHTVGQFAGAEAREADQLRLFLGRRRPVLLGNAVGDKDRRDIGAGAILPGGGQPAVAVEIEVCRKPRARGRRGSDGEGGCRCWRQGIRIVVIGGIRREPAERCHANSEAGRKHARAEHV